MNEPYLHAFRPPKLVAELAAAEIPLSAVLRQGEHESFARPWRLVYLGDPLYAFSSPTDSSRRHRLPPRPDDLRATGQSRCRVLELRDRAAIDPRSSESVRLQACRAAAIASLCHPRDLEPDIHHESRARSPAWHAVLTSIDRQALGPALRPVLDELVIDDLLYDGEFDRLLGWLLRIPPGDCPPRTWQAIENLAMNRLMAHVGAGSLPGALALWEEVMRRRWPAGSPFPAQLTRRLAGFVDSDRKRYLETYRERLSQTADFLAASQPAFPHLPVVKDELKRVEKAIVTPAAHR
jgi:hypothetical protein